MIPIKRNGIFQYTEYIEPNDIQLAEKPCLEAELDELNQWNVDINRIRQAKIQKFKQEVAPELVYVKAPQFKQINSALNIYSEESKNSIISWIQSVRKVSDEIEAEINGLNEIEEIDNYILDFNAIKTRVEEIDAELNGGNKDGNSNN